VRLAELVATFALGQDNAFGQPMGSQLRSCLLAARLAESMGLGVADRQTVYWVAQLRYVGCTGHAHEVAAVFGDEIETRARSVVSDLSNPRELIPEIVRNAGHGHTGARRVRDVLAMLVGGRNYIEMNFRTACEVGDVLLEVRDLTKVGVFRDMTFSVRAGEIVGFAGLIGAGRTEVARVLFGIDQRDAGEIRLRGNLVDFASPSAAMHAGVAYLPEDRHQEGLVLDFTIAQNVTLPILPRLFPRLLVRAATERKVADEYTRQLNVRMTGVDQLVGALSGGNQQKVVLAKWLASNPMVLILDEPTRGIDIGAKVEVHRIISELAASGLGIILISSDLPEVLAMSDRILVLHEGRITAEIPRNRATEERVMFAATGSVEPVTAGDATSGNIDG